jgi:23S rRNA (guanine2445-N2)-methyltransferase / 23S rRNA (guanine2069-N7)-methyltransferase
VVWADAIGYLQSHSAMYDLIFVDPPTFSNSKRADDFDVQRDHVRLLALCGERLLPGGTSCSRTTSGASNSTRPR